MSLTTPIPRFFRRAHLASPWDNGEPIREELFSVERLEEHARSLATAQPIASERTKGLPLAARLADNGAVLLAAYRTLSKAAQERRAITPAAEWLIDNYHVVERQIREIRNDLPPGYYRQLPKLVDGPFAGYPRVLGVAWAFVAHTDSRFDPEMLRRFVRAYQEVQPLTIGELWAVAITLRIVLVENLRRLGERIVRNRAARQEADGLADRLLGAAGREPEPASVVFADYEGTPLADAFVVQLVHRLREQDPRITPALAWLDQRIASQHTTADAIVRGEHQRQGAASVTVRNIITSMRLISDVDWTEMFERVSLVDDVLAAGSGFSDMDFPTRNLYRTAVEDLARGSGRSELDVARSAVLATGQAASAESSAGVTDARRRDPGYHLLAGGRQAFEASIGFRPPLHALLGRSSRALGIRGYVSAGVAVAAFLLALPLCVLAAAGQLDGAWLVLLGALGMIPAIDVAVALVNRGVTRWFGTALLPALELRKGVPSDLRTLIAVPTLLTTVEAIEKQIERLEIHYFSSPDGDLHFALLSDWSDADAEHVEGDEALLAAAAEGIARLNQRHGRGAADRFLLLHRRRVWNESEGRWIGWERKRGKLHELNRLLRGATDTTFVPTNGRNPAMPSGVRYVITLDADTRLPRETVRRLIGKMAHPLNHPRFDPDARRVVEGYAVLQPRVTPSLPVGREGSFFQRVFSSPSGIDPYASAVSDVYQDLFGEGSYTGKGIYALDAFEAALAGRVPDSMVLSHDLFEGVFARAGLASDVEVVEEFPARYDVAALRHHRWARGDWQLLPWIFGRWPIVGPHRARLTMPAIGRWKMLDNLRRTLSAPAAILAFLAGWTLPFDAAALWTGFVLATIVLPSFIPVAAAIVPRRAEITVRSYLSAIGSDLYLALAQSALIVTFLAHQAWLMGDAIVRTLIRLFVTRRHLLEWISAAQTTLGSQPNLLGLYRRMAGAVLIGILSLLVGWAAGEGTWVLAVPFVVLWIASPAIAGWASRSPLVAGRLSMSATDARALRLTARRTWRFFETFVTADDHMLPPDNFQEDPAPVLAHRTSPTNLGLYLLSVVSARDFGWIGTVEAVERIEATLSTMSELARFRGHFYNWYSTRDLQPLNPRYVSSVDSGNLAAHLIALANACGEWAKVPLTDARRLAGVADTVDLTRQEVEHLQDGRRTQLGTFQHVEDALAVLLAGVQKPKTDGEDIEDRLRNCAGQAETTANIARALMPETGDGPYVDLLFWAEATRKAIESHCRDLRLSSDAPVPSLVARLAALEQTAKAMALAMEFGFLFNGDRKLLSIGYQANEGTLDPSCYDLLASEARLASLVAIAKGDVPARHWFRLGRAVTPVAHGAALISWSGSMFEYLMPSLVMRAPIGSLIEQTSRLIVRRQIDYGAKLRVPWGISESAYNARDLELTYQYSNFGVPGLGLKRGLAENVVIAPYATALATMVDPAAAARNFERLASVGARGRHGFYEALDYTPSRILEGESVATVRAFMAHHQGMTIVAIANALLDGAMRTRFHAEPIVQATELLLQERTPRDVAIARPWAAEAKSAAKTKEIELPGGRRLATGYGPTPATHVLSNGRYAVMLTAAGSGYSRWHDLAVTRWREDVTCDDWGFYIYLRDMRSGDIWSAGIQPSGVDPDDYEVIFNEDRAQFVRRDGTLTTTLEVLVSAEEDAEVRRVSISNSGSRVREIEITSYAELVLAPQAADVAHPAFSNLFIETDHRTDVGALLATRRRRAPTEREVWAAHLAVIDDDGVDALQVETDRARFLGRGRGVRAPIAMIGGRPLSGTTGTVLDPIFSVRRSVRIAPGATARVAFWIGIASSREAILDFVDKHQDTTAFERASTLAWTQAQVQLYHLDIRRDEAALFQRLAGHLIYTTPALRASSETIGRGAGGQPGLWPLGISGDLPILLLRISDVENVDMVRQLLRAHDYWRMKRLAIDLVILNERASSYIQDLQIALETAVRAGESRPQVREREQAGRVFVLRADLISAEARALLVSVARAVLVGHRGPLADQLDRVPEIVRVARPAPKSRLAEPSPRISSPRSDLEFFNELGGFSQDGREYVTVLGPGQMTPAPWINVVANPAFGFQVGTEGGGTTWSANSRENQLTPWFNDPVTNRPGEAFYLHDDDTGVLWSATALPVRDETSTYVARHGWGYSRFQHEAHGISLDLVQYVPLDDSVKISRLTIRNLSGARRRLKVTAYVEWVLGASRSASAPFVSTSIDAATGAMFARNPWSAGFGSRIAFADLGGRQEDWTGDRREFIGRNGTLERPAALLGTAPLSNTVGAGLDPCGALRTRVDLLPDEVTEIVFFLGQAASVDDARTLIARYRAADLDKVRSEVAAHWEDVLGAVQVRTPDRAMDILLNGWFLYQTLACRIWARSGFYQASGAYGFRDQLQDGMALTLSRPAMTREHLLRAAARQFVEGDVQHWWLPHSGQGVRTRISDDRAWLAYAVAHYVRTTGDGSVLNEEVPFLDGRRLDVGEHDSFFQPTISDEVATLYEHCARGLDDSLAVGGHGLPLIGTGDWNDGLNRVGEHGAGESVWLGWLLSATLTTFAPIAEEREEMDRAHKWRTHAAALGTALEREAWDGNWYLRGWFDDGTPLGSASNAECRIDSIAQSWAIISGAGDGARASRAMAAVERELIRPRDRLALLFTPPFDQTPLDPGYIKGYPPGIRENGGQYTHAAVWSIMAFAALGDGDKAVRLFSLLNPINHARTRTDAFRYKVEPYVLAADVYASPAHVGRGGWTWYTGSAGWMQRAGIESILGLRVEGTSLYLDPCIPRTWPGFELTFRHGSARYEILVENPDGIGRGIASAWLDEQAILGQPLHLPLADDGLTHRLRVRLGQLVPDVSSTQDLRRRS